MTDYIERLRHFFVIDKKQREYRQKPIDSRILAEEYNRFNLDDEKRAALRLKWVLENEKPIVFKDEKIAIIRTIPVIPELFTEPEWRDIESKHRIHELGKVCNINPGYSSLIDTGFIGKRNEIIALKEKYSVTGNDKEISYLDNLLQVLDAIESFAERYRQTAVKVGNRAVAESFSRIPRQPPRTLLEALQFFRLLHFCLWASFNYHNTIGRIDQYMQRYYRDDLISGRLDRNEALELLEEFFISFNKDSDTYPGMQQGDNGQSLVLGGSDLNGNDQFNELSELCMDASLELRLIDPKINIRVNKKTPLSVFEKGTYMTKEGLGFPQYSNDDIVIPALKNWGYNENDACNYVVAACWEFIVPSVGMDINNIEALSFLEAVMDSLPKLPECETYEEFQQEVRTKIFIKADALCESTKGLYMEPSPMMSLLMDGCTENANDICNGAKYNNYGLHGTGLSSAADSLAAIKKFVFDEHRIGKQELLDILAADFRGHDELRTLLRYDSPKMGNDDDYVDLIGTQLLDWFADALDGKRNERGGLFRPGTGSAMYYLWHSKDTGASPDGRKSGEGLACNFSPSLFARCKGPVSIIKSFSKANLARVANGGPLTIELHDTLFRTPGSIKKVAMFVKTYMDLGGIQMQLNAVNRKTMIDAKKKPEKYRNLIVRVWGWSGYFVELDEKYQDHIIDRMELNM